MIGALITLFILLTTIISAVYDNSTQVIINQEWGNLGRVLIVGYTYDNAQAMEPFISRDGKWLFFNSRNTGTNTSLHYGLLLNSTSVKYLGEIGGEANGPIPHLDAVPAMDEKYNFFWVSTRNYPEDYENLQQGVFDPLYGVVPTATPVHGDFYIREPIWIVMDQEINIDGSILFFVNAHFSSPPGPAPVFSNISLALRNPDGSFTEHPKAVEIMDSVNSYLDPKFLRYSPSSLGPDSLELYFALRDNSTVVSNLYVSKRDSVDSVFGVPELIPLPAGRFIEPEAPTISSDGNLLMFSRLDCPDKYGCRIINVYKLDRLSKPDRSVFLKKGK